MDSCGAGAGAWAGDGDEAEWRQALYWSLPAERGTLNSYHCMTFLLKITVADALKLILKETVVPSQANKVIFYLAPVSTLVFSLLG